MSENIMLCCPVEGSPHMPLSNAMQRSCADCSCAIWVSMASLQNLIERCGEDCDMVCIPCGTARIAKADEPVEFAPPTAGQMEELHRALLLRQQNEV